MAEFLPAPEVETIGKRIVRRHHRHLRNVRIDYMFIDEAPISGGKKVLGSCSKVTGKHALGWTPGAQSSEGLDFFLIVIAKDYWDYMDPKTRNALVDHELCHAWVDIAADPVKLSIITHDIEEFSDVVERHGLWQPNLVEFLDRVRRGAPNLFDEIDEHLQDQADEDDKVVDLPDKLAAVVIDGVMLTEAARVILDHKQVTAKVLEHHMPGVKYQRAGRIIQALEDQGVVTPVDVNGKRKMLMTRAELATWQPREVTGPARVVNHSDQEDDPF